MIDDSDHKQVEESLRASEKRYRLLFEHNMAGVLRTGLDGSILEVNDALARILGFASREEIRDRKVQDLYCRPADREAMLTRLLTQRGLSQYELCLRHKNGSPVWVLANIVLHEEPSGPDVIHGTIIDITERKRAEEALLLFRALIDQSHDGIEVIDPETGRFLDVNETACRAHGYTRDELLALSIPDVAPAADPAAWARTLEELRRLGSRLHIGWHRRKDGSLFPVEVNVAYVRLNRDYIVAVVRDVTERKLAEEAARQSEERLRQAVRVSHLGIFDHDHRTDAVYWSPEERALHGWEAARAPTLDEFVAMLHPEDRPRIAAAIRRAHDPAGDGTFDVEQRIIRPDGEVRWLVTRSQTFFEGEGDARRPLRTVGAVLDVTALKRLEEQLRQALKMEAVGQLAGGVAHDFNNLLTVINGSSELALHRMRQDDPSRGLIAAILEAGERAAALTRQLLAFSRKQVLQPKVLDVNALLSELSELLLRLIGADIGLRLEAGPALGLVKVDPGQFEQAVINLAVNARDAMPGGGRITIETRNVELDESCAGQLPDARPGRYVLVAVSDTGHGMDAATRARIFEPFFTTKGPGRGTGLGLAMVYGFVKQSGGHIEVNSAVDAGTTFKVYLPRTEKPAPADRTPQDRDKVPKGTETILLAEDQDAVRTFARHILLAEGYTVLEARDGEEACRLARERQGPIHLLITDMVMPRMGGQQLADLLARDRPSLRVLFVSGYADDTMTRTGVPRARSAFLQKPYSPDQLAQKVREVLDADAASCR
jgi:PAS domain S-box-containing protein